MSVKIMAQVWECDLPFNKAWVLMAMADHADHEGKNVFPALPLVAWKTGYSLPSVKRIVADLRDDGILKPYSKTAFGVIIYQIDLGNVPRKALYVEPENGRPKGIIERKPRRTQYQINTPSQIDTGFCDTHNHQSLLSNSKETISNSYLIRENSDFQKFSDLGDPFEDD